MKFREYALSVTALLVLLLTLPLAVFVDVARLVLDSVRSYANQVADECEAAFKAREEEA